MVSGIPTASGYEERIRFSELEIVDAGAIDQGVLNSTPEGNYVNGWDVNVAGVRTVSVKRNVRYHKHAVGSTSKLGWVMLTEAGIHIKGQEKRRPGVFRGKTIWRL